MFWGTLYLIPAVLASKEFSSQPVSVFVKNAHQSATENVWAFPKPGEALGLSRKSLQQMGFWTRHSLGNVRFLRWDKLDKAWRMAR
jgi:hypothetical protein